jgi:uncharacterized protein (TIGR02646 family)
MFHGKCAYCESKIAHIEHPHIEHYRPKKKYPDFTFEWENFLLACSVCNGASYKGSKFPLDGNGDPVLINPCVDTPGDHFRFRKGYLVAITGRGKSTRRILGLNRDDLKDYREKQCLRFLYSIASFSGQFRDGQMDLYQEGRGIIKEMLSQNAEFTGMYRQAFLDELEKITDEDLLNDITELILLAHDNVDD